MSIDKLIEISRFYGSNSEFILAGGGNTSFKDKDTLVVKASGTSLAAADADSFVKMDRHALGAIWEKTYPLSSDEREKDVLADLMAAGKEGADGIAKRPSVEALLHDIIPFSFVVHLHPALINGLCCSVNGETAAKEILGEKILWIPSTNPGYILSLLVKTKLSEYYAKYRENAQIILLENHGIFAGADTAGSVKNIYDDAMAKISAKIKRKPDFSDEIRISCEELAHYATEFPAHTALAVQGSGGKEDLFPARKEIMQTIKELSAFCCYMTSKEVNFYIKDRESFYPLSSAFTPDHIVYAGSDPLFINADTPEDVRGEWERHTKKTGRNPKIVAVRNTGVFSAAASAKAAGFALDLFKDSIKVAVFSESFGGPLFMTKDKIDFINNWEVERFRSSVSTK